MYSYVISKEGTVAEVVTLSEDGWGFKHGEVVTENTIHPPAR